MSRLDDYRAHLASPAWKEIRGAAKAVTLGECAFCGAIATSVHHVRYPKLFKDDIPQNTQPVCDRCHRLAHGGSNVRKLEIVQHMREKTTIGTEFAYLISEGIPWGSVDSWCKALEFPSRGQLGTALQIATSHLLTMGVEAVCQYEGVTVYRWSAVAQALRRADASYKAHGYKNAQTAQPGTTTEQWDAWMSKYDVLFLWGTNLQERALASAAHEIRKTSVSTVNQAVAQALGALQSGFVEHDRRIETVEKLTYRDPEEFISAKVAVREKGLDESVMPLFPNDRRNWAGLLGANLAANGARKGPPVPSRLDGTAAQTIVNTWRRSDAYAEIARLLGKAAA